MTVRTMIRNVAAVLAMGAAALAFSTSVAQSASADTGLRAKNHTITTSASFTVTQNNGPFADVTVKSSASAVNYSKAGAESKVLPVNVLSSKWAQSTSADERFDVHEIDSAGTISVRDQQALTFWPGEEVGATVDLTIAPNTTRSFWIKTVNGWGDSALTLVTMTNKVS